MNKEVINAVADAIARSELARCDVGFNMSKYVASSEGWVDQTGHECGTVACIAGWTAMMFDADGNRLAAPDLPSEFSAHMTAQSAMGLTSRQADALFTPDRLDYATITQCQAVAVLRKLAETGKVDWSSAMKGKVT
jgi:hypothetical protein